MTLERFAKTNFCCQVPDYVYRVVEANTMGETERLLLKVSRQNCRSWFVFAKSRSVESSIMIRWGFKDANKYVKLHEDHWKEKGFEFCSEKVLEKMCVCGCNLGADEMSMFRNPSVDEKATSIAEHSEIDMKFRLSKISDFFWHFDFVVGLLWPFRSAPFHQEMHVGPRPGSDETGESTPGVLVVTPLRLEARNESPKITQNNGKQLRVVDWLIRFVHGNVIKGSSVAKLPSYRVLTPPHLTTSLTSHNITHHSHQLHLTSLTAHITTSFTSHITHHSQH